MPRSSDMSVSEEVEHFLTWLKVEKGRSTNTVASYARDLASYVSWLQEHDSDPFAVSPRHIEEFLAHQRAKFAASSVARQLAAIRMFHTFIVRNGVRSDDPCALLEGIRVPIGIPKPLNEDEVDSLLSSVTGDDPRAVRDRALLEFLYATGARISEVCGLNIDDLDLENGLVRLFGKGAKERIVPVGRTARSRLTDYLDGGARNMLEPDAWRSAADRDAVFLTNRGLRLSRQKAWGIVREAGRRSGITRELSPHVLRHSCATHMLEHGADLRIVQELLGHATISTTQVYTRVSPEHVVNVYRHTHPRERS